LYPWGNEKRAEAAHTKEGKIISAQPVGSLAAGVSAFGVYDMIGNVWEWTEDGFAVYPGSTYVVKPEDAGTKIIRGGSFDSTQSETNLCTRIWVSPHRTEPSLGFRCAKNAN
jgi:iron(II)-dependent oxidoreductase